MYTTLLVMHLTDDIIQQQYSTDKQFCTKSAELLGLFYETEYIKFAHNATGACNNIRRATTWAAAKY